MSIVGWKSPHINLVRTVPRVLVVNNEKILIVVDWFCEKVASSLLITEYSAQVRLLPGDILVTSYGLFEFNQPVLQLGYLVLISNKPRPVHVLKPVPDHALLLPVESLEILIKICSLFGPLHYKVPVLDRVHLPWALIIVLLLDLDLPITFS